ncbi:hypothetical protein GCM10027280_63260 [Micromonospora polyrhachis]
MPPDMRQWLRADHPVWVLIEAVRLLDTTQIHARCRTGGVGRAGFDPDMMLTLLFYAYARGIRSSRRIERLCWEDVGFRVICAQDVPDHTTIWRFADMAPQLVENLFAEVLLLCAKAGMGRLETITLDGMKIGANASMKANRSEERIRAELAEVAAEAVAEHRATDTAEDALFGGACGGDQLPEELADERCRGPRLRRALAELEAERTAGQAEAGAKADQYLQRQRRGERIRGNVPVNAEVASARLRLEQAIAARQATIAEWEQRNADKIAATGSGLVGARPRPVDEHFAVVRARTWLDKALARAAERERQVADQRPRVRNVTDPDSRLMPTKSGFIQGYNPQNVVSADHLIIATELTQDTGDVEQAKPMMAAAEDAANLITGAHRDQAEAAQLTCTCPPKDSQDSPPTPTASPATGATRRSCPRHPNGIGTMVMDAGYLSEENLTAAGPDRLIATGKSHDVEKSARTQPADPPPDPDQPHHTDPVQQMAQRLRTPEGIATYRQRGHIAETPHGHIKHNTGIRTLTRRGLDRATAEWKFICATYNINRLVHTLRTTGHLLPGKA